MYLMMPLKKKYCEFSTEVLDYLELNFYLPADMITDSCMNGHVFLLYIKNGRLLTVAVEQVNKLFEAKASYVHIMNLVQKSKRLAEKYSTPVDQQHFEDFCKESFINFMTSSNFNVKPLGDHREFLASNFTFPTEINTTSAIRCLNGHALNLYFNENQSICETTRQIYKWFGVNSNKTHIRRIMLQTKSWVKSFNRAYQNFEILCYEPLELECIKSEKPTATSITSKPPSPTHLSESTQCKDSAQPTTSGDPTSEASIKPRTKISVGTNTGEDLLRLARENLTPREIQLKKRLSFLSQQFAISSEKYKRRVSELKSKLKDMPQKLKAVNQKVKRKNATIKALKKRLRELKRNENRKKIPCFKDEKYTCDWKIKLSVSALNASQIVIANAEKTNPLPLELEEKIEHLQMNEERENGI